MNTSAFSTSFILVDSIKICVKNKKLFEPEASSFCLAYFDGWSVKKWMKSWFFLVRFFIKKKMNGEKIDHLEAINCSMQF